MSNLSPSQPDAALEEKLRSQISLYTKTGNRDAAVQSAQKLLEAFSSAKNFRFLRNLIEKETALPLLPFRIALLSTFSIEFITDALIARGFANSLRISIHLTGFGLYKQEILDPNSGLYQSQADLVILAAEGEDLFPAAYHHFSPIEDQIQKHLADFKDQISVLIQNFRNRLPTPLLIHGLAQPMQLQLGIADGVRNPGQSRLIAEINESLLSICSEFKNVSVLRYADLVSRIGYLNWCDARMKLYAKAPLSQSAISELTREYMKYCRAQTGLSRKCLVLDLDNTLWGGVIGEDGIDGIQLGPNYPGNAFVDFQQNIKCLHARGVLLAIASKNNIQDVDDVFAKHPFMVLRKTDFTACEVHWDAKSESLKRIAQHLNIGLEHMVFVDDNPAECEQVSAALPMVTVIQLPSRPELYTHILLKDGWFDTLNLSQEDLTRAALYEQRAKAEEFRKASTDLESFYYDLDMSVSISRLNNSNLPRASQLTQKTNQFNVTTRRYSEADFEQMLVNPNWLVRVISVKDKFGDNGIVGLFIASVEENSMHIDTFLLSCRVIGRTIETAMLAHLYEMAAEKQIETLRGLIIPSQKNAPVHDLFQRHGFIKENTTENGTSYWTFDIKSSIIGKPLWFKCFID